MEEYDYEYYQDRADLWRWRIIHKNGEIVDASTEGFGSVQSCLRNVSSVARAFGVPDFDTSVFKKTDY